jgi:outer membrane lipoprotein-sorting protein
MPKFRPLILAAAFAMAGGGALAQTDPSAATPLPPKRPDAAVQQQAAIAAPPAIKAPPSIGGAQQVLSQPFDPRAMTEAQKATLEQVDRYFNSIRVMSGSFTQVGPDGSRTEGKFWVSKPGKLRFQYAPPSPIELIADGRSVAVRDRKLNTQDLYLIRQTPLRFLLADKIDLIEDSDVIGVTSDADWVTVTLEERSSIGGTARIQLMFAANTYALKQWTITDAQGYDTTVALYDVDTSSKPSDKLFYINEQRTL